MIYSHRTAQCPGCGKDSWQSVYAAYFSVVECMWCRCKFIWDLETKSFKIVEKG